MMLVENMAADFKPRTIRYYGGKAKLLDFILHGMQQSGLRKGMKVLDGFSGSSVVAQRLKWEGCSTFANDNLYFCYAIADAHLSLDSIPTFSKLKLGVDVFSYLNDVPGENGFITRNYSPFQGCKRMYFTTSNASKIDTIRRLIQEWKDNGLISNSEFNYLLACLIYAINLISNITGTYGAYLKFWEGRSQRTLKLIPINVFPNSERNSASNLDVSDVIKYPDFDFVYLDPPYNSRNYFSNYFLLEVIAQGWFEIQPEPEGLTGITKNIGVKSEFSSKREVGAAFSKLIADINCDLIAISYNNEGLLAPNQLMDILTTAGKVTLWNMEHKRYRSINQDGSNSSTSEKLYVIRKK